MAIFCGIVYGMYKYGDIIAEEVEKAMPFKCLEERMLKYKRESD